MRCRVFQRCSLCIRTICHVPNVARQPAQCTCATMQLNPDERLEGCRLDCWRHCWRHCCLRCRVHCSCRPLRHCERRWHLQRGHLQHGHYHPLLLLLQQSEGKGVALLQRSCLGHAKHRRSTRQHRRPHRRRCCCCCRHRCCCESVRVRWGKHRC